MPSRTFGWVQDASSISNLRRVVEIFDSSTDINTELRDKKILVLVKDKKLKNHFIGLLSSEAIKISYSDLVGRHPSGVPRSESICNGIIQAAIPGQGREFIGDWPANNYLRWAHCVGLITYNKKEDNFKISDEGAALITTSPKSTEEYKILEKAFLSYPPVIRILNLLSDGSHLTKFEIGNKLGFVGEDGFTSLPQNILIRELSLTTNAIEKRTMLSDWEGTSDKYVRMIASWCKQMGWIEQSPKQVTIQIGNKTYQDQIAQAYFIKRKGLEARRKGVGINTQKRIPKRVYWEMLATKAVDRNYVRTRRAHILKLLSTAGKSLKQLKARLAALGFNENIATIEDDIKGLINIGLNVESSSSKYSLRDTVIDLEIPRLPSAESRKSEIQKLIDKCREQLSLVPHDYLVLIEMSFNRNDNRLLEMETIELLINEYGYSGIHLGGASKPDGIIYIESTPNNYGVIIDTKAYLDGFSIPINEKRKMVDYVNKNRSRRGTGWWDEFPKAIREFKFLFVSSSFIGQFRSQLKEISQDTDGTLGSVISTYNMLRLAEKVKSGQHDLISVGTMLGSLDEIKSF